MTAQVRGNLASSFQPVEVGHADVHEHDLGNERLGEGHSLMAVCRFADDLDVSGHRGGI